MKIAFLTAFFFVMNTVSAQNKAVEEKNIESKAIKLNDTSLIKKFYQISHQRLFWFAQNNSSQQLRAVFKDIIDSAANIGLNKANYHYEEIEKYADDFLISSDSDSLLKTDMIFTDAAITFSKDVFHGAGISSWVNSDAISPKYAEENDRYILNKLSQANSDSLLEQFISSLEPKELGYQILKQKLKEQIQNHSDDTIRQLSLSLNLFRWIRHFNVKEYIVVNIASATLRYYQDDALKLTMKVVVGKPSTRTPRFAAYCNEIVLYPYWNVPHKIAVNELLPIARKSPDVLELMNMQVLDNKGSVLDMNKINWKTFNKNNFPYRFRQSTGCDNALGVIKFNLTSPYDVYMHDTNLKSAFQSGYRYYSHGCIRVEKPIELGNYLLDNKLDSSFLQSCLKNQVSIPVTLGRKIPVFVIYTPVEIDDSGKVRYYKDIYRLFR